MRLSEFMDNQTKKHNDLKTIKVKLLGLAPKTSWEKVKLNINKSIKTELVDTYRDVLSLTSTRTAYVPVDNLELVVESLKVVDAGLYEYDEYMNLCMRVLLLRLGEEAEERIADVMQQRSLTAAMIAVNNEIKKREEFTLYERQLKIQAEKDLFEKHVGEILLGFDKYITSDGVPRYTDVNLTYLINLFKENYTQDELIESFKRYLKADSFNVLMQIIEKRVKKGA